MADFGLADAVDAAEALFNPVRIPGQVVVDHEMRAALKVHAFAGGIVRDHDAHDRIRIEGGDGGAACLAGNAAMDHDDGSRLADPRGDLLLQIFERVLRLGEDHDLAPQARCGIEHDRLVEDRFKLSPFGVLPRQLQTKRPVLEILQDDDLGLQFGERCSRRRLIDDLLLSLLGFSSWYFVDVVGIIGRQMRGNEPAGQSRAAA